MAYIKIIDQDKRYDYRMNLQVIRRFYSQYCKYTIRKQLKNLKA